jgi:hypothetical protein
MPRGFFSAFLAPAPLGFEGSEASSSFKRASFSAFFRAASAFFASAASLHARQRTANALEGEDVRLGVRLSAGFPFLCLLRRCLLVLLGLLRCGGVCLASLALGFL